MPFAIVRTNAHARRDRDDYREATLLARRRLARARGAALSGDEDPGVEAMLAARDRSLRDDAGGRRTALKFLLGGIGLYFGGKYVFGKQWEKKVARPAPAPPIDPDERGEGLGARLAREYDDDLREDLED